MVALFLGSVWLACLARICWLFSLSPLELLRQHSHLGLPPWLEVWQYPDYKGSSYVMYHLGVANLWPSKYISNYIDLLLQWHPSSPGGARLSPNSQQAIWFQNPTLTSRLKSKNLRDIFHAPVPCSSWTHHLLLLQHDLELSDSPYHSHIRAVSGEGFGPSP